MILEIKTEDAGKALKVLKDAGIEFEQHHSGFSAFLKEELIQCEDCYSDTFGEDTLKKIKEEVDEDANNTEIDCISKLYYEVVQRYSGILDAPTIGTYVISNNLVVQLKELLDDEFTVVVGNEVYIGETVIDEEDKECVQIGEMLLPICEFVRV